MRDLNPFPPNLDAPVARSLSIQFILQALIDAFALILELKKTIPLQLKGVDLKKEILCIANELKKIHFFSLENPLSQKEGILDKLYFYSEILANSSEKSDAEMTVIMEEMRRSILLTKSKMVVWKKTSRYPPKKMLEHLMQLLSDLERQFCLFFEALTPFFGEGRSDENVLIYLIENREKLNRHLGPRYIETLLQSFFPAGRDQLRAVIHEGYTRRGFSAFLSSVEPMIEAVSWNLSE